MFSGCPAASFGNARIGGSFTDVTSEFSGTFNMSNTKFYKANSDVTSYSWVFNKSYGGAISTVLRPINNIE